MIIFNSFKKKVKYLEKDVENLAPRIHNRLTWVVPSVEDADPKSINISYLFVCFSKLISSFHSFPVTRLSS